MTNPDPLKQKVKDQFSRNAQKYVESESHAKNDDLILMTEWLQPQDDWVTLDAATGGGHVAKQLAPHVAHLFATDLTVGMLAAAQKHVTQHARNVWFVVADAEDLPFLDHSFDAVTCRIAAHHFSNPRQFILETARVLKPGGKLLLIDNIVPEDDGLDEFVNKIEKLRDASHVRCYRVKEWMTWMKEAGLVEEKSRVRKKTFEFPAWVKRTSTSKDQVKEVEKYIRQAVREKLEYIGLDTKHGEISSIQIDEWMIMLSKQAREN